ncbi:MAG TPA: hypothetical protein VMA77_12540 [Solirubrobacteraceae bacterium]|nr:hypothetical protein [Solirubrobacteraceae bacterium]
MSQSFSYDLSVDGSPADAQARVQAAVTERMRQAAKMRLASHDSNSLSFRPQWSWPLLAALFRVIGGEAVTLSFSAANGGTRITVSGKVAGDAEKVANQDFWAQTLR